MARPYVINFEHLSPGQHDFTFEVNKKLFEQNMAEELLDAKFDVNMTMLKSETMMDMHFHYNGHFKVSCDRCNGDLTLPINEEGNLIVKYGQEEHEEFDELIVLAANEFQIDLSHYLYESLGLLLPQRRIHNEKDCDPEFLKLLTDPKNEKESGEIDPRWEKLKKLS